MSKKKQTDSISTNINGLNVIISTHNIHIEDSYRVAYPPDIKQFLEDIQEFLSANHITMDTPFNHRFICSMKQEWIAHNNAYFLNYKPERTKSVDLNYPQKWYMPILYFFCSLIIV